MTQAISPDSNPETLPIPFIKGMLLQTTTLFDYGAFSHSEKTLAHCRKFEHKIPALGAYLAKWNPPDSVGVELKRSWERFTASVADKKIEALIPEKFVLEFLIAAIVVRQAIEVFPNANHLFSQDHPYFPYRFSLPLIHYCSAPLLRGKKNPLSEFIHDFHLYGSHFLLPQDDATLDSLMKGCDQFKRSIPDLAAHLENWEAADSLEAELKHSWEKFSSLVDHPTAEKIQELIREKFTLEFLTSAVAVRRQIHVFYERNPTIPDNHLLHPYRFSLPKLPFPFDWRGTSLLLAHMGRGGKGGFPASY